MSGELSASKERPLIRQILRRVLLLLLLGGGYYIWLSVTHVGIPCVFRTFTGFLCPGCGVTHMMMEILKGNFSEAFEANRFLFVTLPFLVGELIYTEVCRARKRKMSVLNHVLLICYTVCLLGFGVLRNIIHL